MKISESTEFKNRFKNSNWNNNVNYNFSWYVLYATRRYKAS